MGFVRRFFPTALALAHGLLTPAASNSFASALSDALEDALAVRLDCFEWFNQRALEDGMDLLLALSSLIEI